MTSRSIQAFADDLFAAERDRSPILPLSEQNPNLGIEDAYTIQLVNVKRRLANGDRIGGRKVGLTSKAMQEMFGVHEPDFGVLYEDMFLGEDEAVNMSSLISPRVESEIAFLLESDLAGPGVNTTAALRATAGVFPAIEVIDSRFTGWKIQLVDTIADNASAARVVLGGTLTPISGLDLRLVGGVFTLNGEIAETGAGAAVLGHPARCVAWLANKLSEFGEKLHAGDIIMAGSIHRSVDVKQGDVIRADFDRLGSVTARFTA